MEVSEGHHHEESIYNERYELVNVDMEGGIIRGHGPLFGKIYEDLIGDSPF